MPRKIIIFLAIVSSFLMLLTSFNSIVSAYSVVDTETVSGNTIKTVPDMIFLNENIYITSYADSGDDLNIHTYSIDDSGQIDYIAEYELDTNYGISPRLQQVNDGIIVCCYGSTTGIRAKTFYVSTDGGIIQSVLANTVLNSTGLYVIGLSYVKQNMFIVTYFNATVLPWNAKRLSVWATSFTVSSDGLTITVVDNKRVSSPLGYLMTDTTGKSIKFWNDSNFAGFICIENYGYNFDTNFLFFTTFFSYNVSLSAGLITVKDSYVVTTGESYWAVGAGNLVLPSDLCVGNQTLQHTYIVYN